MRLVLVLVPKEVNWESLLLFLVTFFYTRRVPFINFFFELLLPCYDLLYIIYIFLQIESEEKLDSRVEFKRGIYRPGNSQTPASVQVVGKYKFYIYISDFFLVA